MPRIISASDRKERSGDVFVFDEFPVAKSEDAPETAIRSRRYDVTEEPGLSSLMGSLRKIGNKCGRNKPKYADCWLIGSHYEMEAIESYETSYGKVIIGNAVDGEMEYNLTPKEYRYGARVNDLIITAIDLVRDRYRKSGGSIDRNTVNTVSRGYFEKELDKAEQFSVSIQDLCDTVYRYTLGLGIFEILLNDSRLEDIYIDAPCETNRVHVTLNQVNGFNSHVRCRTNLMVDNREIRNLITRLMRDTGLPYCESNPIIETDMYGGSARVTIVGYPLSPNGDSVAIRKHSTMPWTLTRLIGNGTLDPKTAGVLSFLVDNRSTFMICGARGSGKSSLLSALMFEFPMSQRILTIEDTIELPGEKMRAMGYKVQTMLIDDRMEGDATKRADEALRVSLRMGESAIILGEVRGEEAKTLYQSMRTGRSGSSIMGTIHGDSAKSVYECVIHDMQISPEAFMATDFLITMGTIRERGTMKQSRKLLEMVSTSNIAGEFIDISSQEGFFVSPAVKRMMNSIRMDEDEVLDEIQIRSEMRSFLAEMAEKHGDGFYGPEWIALANDHLSKHVSAGDDKTEIIESFRSRFQRFGGE